MDGAIRFGLTARFVRGAGSDPYPTLMPRLLTAADFRTGLAFYALSSAVVVLAVWFGHRFGTRWPGWLDDDKDFLGALCRYDGNWYLTIVTGGYSFDPDASSNVAFFPAYPLTARAVMRGVGCRPEVASLLVAHVFLAATFVLLHAYLRVRAGNGRATPPADLVLLAFALFPTTFFFRLGYTESMFAFWCVLILFGVERGWHPLVLALIAGAATATRAPGAALGFVVLAVLWQRSPTWGRFVRDSLIYGPVCGWGLFAYVAYQGQAFGEPLAFAKAQVYWNGHPNQTAAEAVVSVPTLEPVWNTYNPSSPRWWAKDDQFNHTPFSLQLANPVYFLLSCAAVAWGGWRRRLTAAELALAVGLLLIPYLTRAYPNSMSSFGRFVAVVIPMYIVFGDWLRRLSAGWVGLVAAVAAVWLIGYSALFGAAWWLV